MTFSKRRLPHIDAVGWAQFVTFRLKDTLPTNRSFPGAALTSGEAFRAIDRILDQGRYGPTYLAQSEVAQAVLDSINCGVELGQYELHAWVIMSNHVHLLVTPQVGLPKLLCSLKAASARRANLILCRHGPFWQDESYDHLVRDGAEFRQIWRYIEGNPVAAGVVMRAEAYLWSSAGRPGRPPQAKGLPHCL